MLTGVKLRTYMTNIFNVNNWWIEVKGLEDVSDSEPKNVLIKANPLNLTEDTPNLEAKLVKVENSDDQYALFSGGRIMIEYQESDEWKYIRGAPKKYFTNACEDLSNTTDPVKDAGHYFLGARIYFEDDHMKTIGERWLANLRLLGKIFWVEIR